MCWWWAGQLSVEWAFSQMMSLTLTVPWKSQHPSLCTFTDADVDPRWSVLNIVSLLRKCDHANTLGFTHTCNARTKPQKETLDICYYLTHTTPTQHIFAINNRHIQGTQAHVHTVLHFPVLQGFNFPSPDVARALIHCPFQGKPSMFLSSVIPGKAKDWSV